MKATNFELERLITEAQEAERSANFADFKQTGQKALDEIKNTLMKAHEKGQEILSEISEEDRARCKKLYVFFSKDRWAKEKDSEKLVLGLINRATVVAPKYVFFYERLKTLREILVA